MENLDPLNAQRIGLVVRRARRAKGWTIDWAATMANMSNKTWTRVEAGEVIHPGTARRVAKLFDLPEDALLAATAHSDGYIDLARQLDVDVADHALADLRQIADAVGIPLRQRSEEDDPVQQLVKSAPLPVVIGALIDRLIGELSRLGTAEEDLLKALTRYNSAALASGLDPTSGTVGDDIS